MERWFLLEFRVAESHLSDGKVKQAVFPKVQRLIQAQTEIEAVAKFKMFGLEKNQEYLSHKNLTLM